MTSVTAIVGAVVIVFSMVASGLMIAADAVVNNGEKSAIVTLWFGGAGAVLSSMVWMLSVFASPPLKAMSTLCRVLYTTGVLLSLASLGLSVAGSAISIGIFTDVVAILCLVFRACTIGYWYGAAAAALLGGIFMGAATIATADPSDHQYARVGGGALNEVHVINAEPVERKEADSSR